jgi:hypothetical protein
VASDTSASRATTGMVISAPDSASRLAASTMARRVRCFWFTRSRLVACVFVMFSMLVARLS